VTGVTSDSVRILVPATPLAMTAADVLAWDRQRGEPPLTRGFSDAQEAAALAAAAGP